MTVQEIAEWLNAEFEGDGAMLVEEVADIADAGSREIAFVAGRKAVSQAGSSKAGCLLVPLGFPKPAGRTVIRVDDPRAGPAESSDSRGGSAWFTALLSTL